MNITDQEKQIMQNAIRDYKEGIITIDKATEMIMPICDRIFIGRVNEIIRQHKCIEDVDGDLFKIKIEID